MTLTMRTHVALLANAQWRCLWKELRERRWWAICWALALLALSLLMHAQHFCGDTGGTSLWPPTWGALPPLLAGIVGLGGYGSELRRGRALFLFSRAVHWQQLLLAKVLYGAIIILGAPAAACLFRLTCAEPYRHLVTLSHVLAGIGALAWPMALCYLGGLACSVVLPGLAGGVLTIVSIALAYLLALSGGEVIAAFGKPFINDAALFGAPFAMLFFVLLGICWGGMAAARSGLYRDHWQRIKLFAPKCLLTMMLGGLLVLCLPQALANRLFLHWFPARFAGTISPGGSYAMVSAVQHYAICGLDVSSLMGTRYTASRTDCIRLADNKLVRRMPWPKDAAFFGMYNWTWLTDSVAFDRNFSNGNTQHNLIFHANTNSLIVTPPGNVNPFPAPVISPNGQLAVAISNTYDEKRKCSEHCLWLCNLANGYTAEVPINDDPVEDGGYAFACWWESNTAVGSYYRYELTPWPLNAVPRIVHEEVLHVRVPAAVFPQGQSAPLRS